MVFATKICALIENLAYLPDLISSVVNEPSSSALKTSNSEEPNTKAAEISNINHFHGNFMEELDDICMDAEESNSEFVSRIIEQQIFLIDNGSANLIPRKFSSTKPK
ncbi:hypothetical protein ACOME3_009018 [Neoechinorhynchus agilis]